MSSVGHDYILKDTDVPHLVKCLTSISFNWVVLGTALDLPTSVIDMYRSRNSTYILSLENILSEWVKGQGSQPVSLGQLVKTLGGGYVGHGRVAGDLISEFNKVLAGKAPPSLPERSRSPEVAAAALDTNKIVDIDKLKALRPKLKKAMRHDATWLATEMNTEGMLSDDNYEAISDSRVNIEPNGKVEMMISDLFDKIELDSDNLNTFVAILKKKPKGYKEAIKFLEDKNLWKDEC